MFGIYTKIRKIYCRRAARQNLDARVIKDWNPDSNYLHKMFPEIKPLWKEWVKDNEVNNCFDFSRFYAFILNVGKCLREVQGSIAELGVYKGNSAMILKYYADKYNRKLFLFDTFEGFDVRDLHGIEEKRPQMFGDISIDYVRERIGGSAIYRKGYFPESLDKGDFDERFSFVSLDCDLHDPMVAGLKFFYPRMNRGGYDFLS